MRAVIRTSAAVRSARATRRDLLLETLALRHQLGVLARSNRRFRPADRLCWRWDLHSGGNIGEPQAFRAFKIGRSAERRSFFNRKGNPAFTRLSGTPSRSVHLTSYAAVPLKRRLQRGTRIPYWAGRSAMTKPVRRRATIRNDSAVAATTCSPGAPRPSCLDACYSSLDIPPAG
jgi:hypothetical protein